MRPNGRARWPAIRLAVRDLSCLQAPVWARAREAPGTGEGLLLQVARDTTIHNGAGAQMPGCGSGVSLTAR
jgi:hypothetical protein